MHHWIEWPYVPVNPGSHDTKWSLRLPRKGWTQDTCPGNLSTSFWTVIYKTSNKRQTTNQFLQTREHFCRSGSSRKAKTASRTWSGSLQACGRHWSLRWSGPGAGGRGCWPPRPCLRRRAGAGAGVWGSVLWGREAAAATLPHYSKVLATNSAATDTTDRSLKWPAVKSNQVLMSQPITNTHTYQSHWTTHVCHISV